MNNTEWMIELQNMDTLKPTVQIEGETVYTLYMKDFMLMPDVNFPELTEVDVSLRSLLN